MNPGLAHGFAGAVALTVACSSAPMRPERTPPAPGPTALPPATPAALALPVAPAPELLACFDLPPDDARSHELSGLAWDPAEQRLFAVSDRNRALTVLVPRPDLAGFDLAPSIPLDIAIDDWDGEGLALAGDRFLVVANESQPAVFSVDRAGHDARPLALPFRPGLRHNLGIEGIGYATAGARRYVFTVNEQALEGDGPVSTVDHGTVVRLTRHSLDGEPVLEVAYLTDPVFTAGYGDAGVSDLAALSPERVLILERSWVRGAGNAIRVYIVDLRGAPSIAALDDARRAAPIAKRLILDLATVDDTRCSTPPAPQRRKIFDNYEGLAVGPVLDDGRRVLFLVSDDNDRSDQLPRALAVALPLGEP
ncbi:MAG TPA: esterase-like activity of phytase family protein [Kofleriaceae bacterium]|nr:esterase-like activity of phytase family protein [Kofleriaceae bacterium]